VLRLLGGAEEPPAIDILAVTHSGVGAIPLSGVAAHIAELRLLLQVPSM
jgi:hypothetical protein